MSITAGLLRQRVEHELKVLDDLRTPGLDEEGINVFELACTADAIARYLKVAGRVHIELGAGRAVVDDLDCLGQAGMAHYLAVHLEQLADALEPQHEANGVGLPDRMK